MRHSKTWDILAIVRAIEVVGRKLVVCETLLRNLRSCLVLIRICICINVKVVHVRSGSEGEQLITVMS